MYIVPKKVLCSAVNFDNKFNIIGSIMKHYSEEYLKRVGK